MSTKNGLETHTSGLEAHKTGMEAHKTGQKSYMTGLEVYKTWVEADKSLLGAQKDKNWAGDPYNLTRGLQIVYGGKQNWAKAPHVWAGSLQD